MKKIGALILVIAVVLGFSWYSGSLTEQGLENYASTISEKPGYLAELNSYEQGLFHSVATFTIKLDMAMLMGGMDPQANVQLDEFTQILNEGISFNIDIFHGPLVVSDGIYPGLFKADITLDQSSPFIATLLEEAPDPIALNDYFNASIRMNYFGNGALDFSIVEMDYADEEGELLWGGLESTSTLSDYGRSYTMNGTLLPLSLNSPEMDFSVSPVLFSGSGSNTGSLIYDSDGKVTIDSIAINSSDAVINIHGVELEAVIVTNDAGTFTLDYQVSTGGIDSNLMQNNINNMLLDFSIRDMSIQGFTDFYNTSMKANSLNDPFQAQMIISESLSSLFEGTPVFEINELSYSQGADLDFTLSADLGLTENVFANPAVMQGNPFLAMNALKANLDVDLSEPLFQMALETYMSNQLNSLDMDPQFVEQMRQQQMAQIQAMTAQFIQAGYLVNEGGRYTLQASMENSQLQVNGMPLPLPF